MTTKGCTQGYTQGWSGITGIHFQLAEHYKRESSFAHHVRDDAYTTIINDSDFLGGLFFEHDTNRIKPNKDA